MFKDKITNIARQTGQIPENIKVDHNDAHTNKVLNPKEINTINLMTYK